MFKQGHKHSEKWYQVMRNQKWNKGRKGKSKKWYSAMLKLSGSNNPNWKGGTITFQGYRSIRVHGKRIFEHRFIMEKKLGRKLLRSEIIHHKDGNKINNSESNLSLFKSVGQHNKHHYPKGSKFGKNQLNATSRHVPFI